MPNRMVGKPCFNSALFSNLFENGIKSAITRNWENSVISSVTFVLLYYPFRYFQ